MGPLIGVYGTVSCCNGLAGEAATEAAVDPLPRVAIAAVGGGAAPPPAVQAAIRTRAAIGTASRPDGWRRFIVAP